MNIFYIDQNPKKCAQHMVDKHVVKMILETAQLLSTAHRLLDGKMVVVKSHKGRNVKRWILDNELNDKIYQATHINHPSTVWTRERSGNYKWLYEHFLGLLEEYTYRYEKKHKCEELVKWLEKTPKNMPLCIFAPPYPAMDNKYIISEDSLTNYRNYYKNGKTHLYSWKNREPPKWLQ